MARRERWSSFFDSFTSGNSYRVCYDKFEETPNEIGSVNYGKGIFKFKTCRVEIRECVFETCRFH